MNPLHACIAIIVAYLLGSIPFGLLIGFAKGVDIRESGSGNIGATNAGRVLGTKWGILSFVLDVLKGLGPVLGAGAWFGLLGHDDIDAASAGWWLGVGVAGVLGHVFPIYLKFKGGKGVATGFGTLLGYWPFLTLPALGSLVVWVILVAIFRYVSLGSVVGALSLSGWLWGVAAWRGWSLERVWPFAVVIALMTAVVIVRHRGNIGRLLAGTESKIGSKKTAETGAEGAEGEASNLSESPKNDPKSASDP
ncbi:MAG: glycerol-3-phosphate 1-O-acyltransferase PlsY [Phycisphaera sp.]|nr:glycerol-3-phosphate 1-O-acyltransferase PlsY [Phycisphaera sp.]